MSQSPRPDLDQLRASGLLRRIVRIEPEPPGWEAHYDCGHSAWWALEPSIEEIVCAQCVEELVERWDGRRATGAALEELAGAGLIRYQLSWKATGRPATAADLLTAGYDELHLNIVRIGPDRRAPEGLSARAQAMWDGLRSGALVAAVDSRTAGSGPPAAPASRPK
jgi:hypothetical protein